MKPHARGLIAALCMALSVTSAAQTVSGVGARDCAAFQFALDKNSDQALDAYVAWTQGFISAFNWSNVRQLDVRIDGPAIIQWLADYCAAHPRAPLYEGVKSLVEANAR